MVDTMASLGLNVPDVNEMAAFSTNPRPEIGSSFRTMSESC
jgi:hypothetical protein